MHIEITYDDGRSEVVPAKLEGGIVSQGDRWLPGVLPGDPELCYFQSDYFLCAINEGEERQGVVKPEPGDVDPDTGKPEWVGFTWKLVGSEQDESRSKMASWIDRLGAEFDPWRKGEDYLHGGLLKVLDASEIRSYDNDSSCWATYLDDAEAVAAEMMRERGHEPAWAASKPGM